MTFWVNRQKRKYKDVERELAKARAKKMLRMKLFRMTFFAILQPFFGMFAENFV